MHEFGEQWVNFQENEGYYGNLDVFEDILGELLSIEDIKGKSVAEIGSGTGRIVNMLAQAGAAKIVAIEPSEAMGPLKKNTAGVQDRITYIQEMGDRWAHPDLDYVFSIGVLHHIFDPFPTIKNAFANLKPGGKFVIWVYGRENNELYLRLAEPIRALTTRIPHIFLAALSWPLLLALDVYVALCKIVPLPMRSYMLNHIARLNQHSRRITIYDQLNPTWAKYYFGHEAEDLLKSSGFTDVRSFHRHGYSWTVVGTKPL